MPIRYKYFQQKSIYSRNLRAEKIQNTISYRNKQLKFLITLFFIEN